MLTGPDISHHQASVDLPAVARAGHAFVILKATEGTSYVDPTLKLRRAQAHAAGLAVGMYHFARAGDAQAEAEFFCRVVGPLQPGEFVVLDWEVPHSDPPGWCADWLKPVKQRLATRPWVYMNSSTLRGYDWSKVAVAGHNQWLAKYDNSTAPVTTVGYWPIAAKQYTDRGITPGVAGPVDLNVFYGDHAALTGTQEDDMTPEQANQLAAIYQGLFFGGESTPAGQSLFARVEAVPQRVWWETTVDRASADTPDRKVPALQELADAKTLILALQAAVQALASARDMTADEVKNAVAQALQENAVHVEVSVAGSAQPAA